MQNFDLDQIKNGGLLTIIHFHMAETVDLVIFARF